MSRPSKLGRRAGLSLAAVPAERPVKFGGPVTTERGCLERKRAGTSPKAGPGLVQRVIWSPAAACAEPHCIDVNSPAIPADMVFRPAIEGHPARTHRADTHRVRKVVLNRVDVFLPL